MAAYVSNVVIPMEPPWPEGSVEQRLGVNRQRGVAFFTPNSLERLAPDLLRFVPEFDGRLPPQERARARTQREAEDRAAEVKAKQEAIAVLRDTKAIPAGFAVVQHPERTTGCSLGVGFGDGFLMIRASALETASTFGFRVAPYPDSLPPEAAPPDLGNRLPPVPLAVVKHADPNATTGIAVGVALGEGYRLVKVSDLKYLVSLGWEPSAWPPAQ
jgi:hypothetical protein